MDRYEIINKCVSTMRCSKTTRWINEENTLRSSVPAESGVYLVGNTAFNPYSNEKLYFVKVGLSCNLQKRMKNYCSSNPSLFYIDFLEFSDEEKGYAETIFHWVLLELGGDLVDGSDEWFKVSEETYLTICKTGFAGLMLYSLQIDDEHLEELSKIFS